MNNRINEDEVISDLFKSFNQDNVILFVGSSAIDNGELTEKNMQFAMELCYYNK